MRANVFSRMIFHFDKHGRLYKDEKPVDHHPAPVTLWARVLRCKGFDIMSGENHRSPRFGSMPCLKIFRTGLIKPETDPYNDDGRPATCCNLIVCPTLEFVGSVVTVVGFEMPNLVWAGMPAPAYEGRTKLKLPKDQVWEKQYGEAVPWQFEDLHKQVIDLVV